jgi:hypothetical protein
VKEVAEITAGSVILTPWNLSGTICVVEPQPVVSTGGQLLTLDD